MVNRRAVFLGHCSMPRKAGNLASPGNRHTSRRSPTQAANGRGTAYGRMTPQTGAGQGNRFCSATMRSKRSAMSSGRGHMRRMRMSM